MMAEMDFVICLSVCISFYEYIEQDLLAFKLSDHSVLAQNFPGREITVTK